MTVAVVVVMLFTQMERNEIVSFVARTAPNKLTFDWTYVSSVLPYVLPLLVLLTAQSTGLSNLVADWLEPVR